MSSFSYMDWVVRRKVLTCDESRRSFVPREPEHFESICEGAGKEKVFRRISTTPVGLSIYKEPLRKSGSFAPGRQFTWAAFL